MILADSSSQWSSQTRLRRSGSSEERWRGAGGSSRLKASEEEEGGGKEWERGRKGREELRRRENWRREWFKWPASNSAASVEAEAERAALLTTADPPLCCFLTFKFKPGPTTCMLKHNKRWFSKTVVTLETEKRNLWWAPCCVGCSQQSEPQASS